MKFFIVLLACLSSFFAKAQDRGVFTCSSTEACVASVDSLLHGAKRVYKLIESYPYDRQSRYILEYKGAKPGSTDSTTMRVVFIKRTKGANPALETEGETVYELQAMYGKYLDLFPIWNTFIDTTADKEALAARGYSDRKKFDNPDGSGEEYNFKEDTQDKSKWQFSRSSWYKTTRL